MPDIQINALDGSFFPAYAAMPAAGQGPGLLIIHEIFGLNPVMRALCDSFAARGYVAVCPNLFARQGLTDKEPFLNEPDWERASVLYKNFDIEAGIRDLLATLAHIRQTPLCAGKVGAIGSCLGGRLAFLLAARSDIDCAVGYYGVGIDSMLDEAYDIRVPYLLHVGEQDKLFPAAVQKRVFRALEKNPLITICKYQAADHGFARPNGLKFQPEAADEANKKTVAFLEAHLSA